MKFSLISDMHVDHPQPKTPYDLLEEVVVVAGDTANGLEGLRFLNKLQRKGHKVLVTDGNHEHYSNFNQQRKAEETVARFREEFPDKETVEGVRFCLRNGWYQVQHEALWRGYMNDSRNAMLSAEEVNKLAEDDANYIKGFLEKCRMDGEQAVVVTHTAPCEETLDPRYEGHWSNDWYWNPLCRDVLREYKDYIYVWCHGHTHAKNEAIVDGVQVVCNPRGYPGENPKWQPLTIEIKT